MPLVPGVAHFSPVRVAERRHSIWRGFLGVYFGFTSAIATSATQWRTAWWYLTFPQSCLISMGR